MVNLFTRPRRFGKTLTLSMLQYFFEDERNDNGEKRDNRYIFNGLRIMDMGEKYRSLMGVYPVIFLTLKGGKQKNFNESINIIAEEISDEFKRHSYILKDKRLDDKTKSEYLTLAIPNQEVLYIFENKIRGWFGEKLKKRDPKALFRAVEDKDAGAICTSYLLTAPR